MMNEPHYVYAVMYLSDDYGKYLGTPTLFARKEDAERDCKEQLSMGREGFEVVELQVFG